MLEDIIKFFKRTKKKLNTTSRELKLFQMIRRSAIVGEIIKESITSKNGDMKLRHLHLLYRKQLKWAKELNKLGY